uniref:UPAR/Ly6 domain-containing protein n=1 Tax=Leptobrachium leishanense TaxID=445787 RepID=A0A8C5PT57_9ANUR
GFIFWAFAKLVNLHLVDFIFPFLQKEFFVFCSGWAIECYNCPTTKCDKTIKCTPPQDVCIKIDSIRQCFESAKCLPPIIASTFGINNFNSSCCPDNLCNSGRTSLPVTSLILSLVAAVLFICYP